LDFITNLKALVNINFLNNYNNCYIGKFIEKGNKIPINTAEFLILFDIDLYRLIIFIGFKEERYFIIFICRSTRAIWVYILKYKLEVFDVIINFYNIIKTQFNINIKIFYYNNIKELKSKRLGLFANKKNILFKYISFYSPAQNGIAEKFNRYIIERLIAIYKTKNIFLFFWSYLIKSIVYIKNQIYNSIINKTPIKAISNKKPNIYYLQILGFLYYILIFKEKRKDRKLSDRANIDFLINYKSNNNFLIYIPNIKKVINTKNIIIKEKLEFNSDYQTIPNGEINEFLFLLD
jgi:hypothetical protein